MAEIPELRPPKKDNSMEEAFLKAQKGTDGFAKKLTDIINEQDQKPMPISHKSGDYKAAIAKSACDAVNRRHQDTRELIDRRMQDHLMENGGRVDLWPDSVSVGKAGWKDIDYDDVRFDYFGDVYVVKSEGSKHAVARKSREFIYRNTYKAPDSPEFCAIQKRYKDAQKEMDKAHGQVSHFLVLLFFVGAVYLAYALLSVIGDMIFGISKSFVEPLYYSWGLDVPGEGVPCLLKNIAYILLGGPAYLHYMLKDGIGGPAGTKIYWIIVVIALLFMAGGAVLCWVRLHETRASNREYKRAKAAFREIADSEEYKRAGEENEQWKRDSKAFSEQWHREWFQWVKAHKEYGGQSAVEAALKGAAGVKQTLREAEARAAMEEMGFDPPEGVTAVQWTERFTGLLDEGMEKCGAEDIDQMAPEDRQKVMEEVLYQMAKENLI